MAPEQLAGGTATTKTDLYALGLVLYEVFTGTPAFRRDSADDRRRSAAGMAPPPPSSVLTDIDADIDRVIVRCLDPDPSKRPPSARAVLASLPVGDPLMAALAAGETPSPEMVAAAGDVGSLRPIVAWGCFLTIVAGFVLAAVLNVSGSGIYELAPFDTAPDVLEARARLILEQAGYQGRRIDSARGFEYDFDYYRAYLTGTDSALRWKKLAAGRPALVRFWYREGSQPLVPWSFRLAPTSTDPPAIGPDMATVVLDSTGRLILLLIGPPNESASEPTQRTLDWSRLFAQAGLRTADFKVVAPVPDATSVCRHAGGVGRRVS